MYCVIQEVPLKKPDTHGEYKEIAVDSYSFTINGNMIKKYTYTKGGGQYERPVRKAYKISVHESYRENGRVRKRQTSICTIGYYDIIDWGDWIGDHCNLDAKAESLGVTAEELTDMIYGKFQPITDRVMEEYQQTEEYAAKKEHERILNEHRSREEKFNKKYKGLGEYSECYDVFGTLREPERLKQIETQYRFRQEYEEKSRSYWEDYWSNYTGSFNMADTIDPQKAEAYKAIYKAAAKALHPDANPGRDTSGAMQVLNELKQQWGV